MTEIDPSSISPEQWLDGIHPAYRDAINAMVAQGSPYETIATVWLSKAGPENTFSFGAGGAAGNFFEQVKAEFNKLVCGDAEYEDLRKRAAEQWQKGGSYVSVAVAAFIGAKLGIAAAVLIPVIALLFAAASRIGLKAWCETKK
jgi:hypothetical protein